MMTLDGAIEHANQVADSYKGIAPACKCAHEHRQLAESRWAYERDKVPLALDALVRSRL